MNLIRKLRSLGRDGPVQPYECARCGLTFKRRRFSCPVCGRVRIRKRTEQ